MIPFRRYDVLIDNSGGNFDQPAPADGFADWVTLSEYVAGSTEPASVANSKAKARANYRWRLLTQYLNEVAWVADLSLVSNAGATVDLAPTQLQFRVAWQTDPLVEDELNAGQYLTGTAAVRRAVVRPFVWDHNVVSLLWWDPSPLPDKGWFNSEEVVGNPFASAGNLTNRIAAAEALVTVTQLL